MSALGKALREKRESLNLSLSEASLATKISARMIASMEEGDLKALPALPFAKGFVRSYANYLKLDPEKMVGLYLEEIGEAPVVETELPEPQKEAKAPPAKVDINRDTNSLARYIIIGSVIFLITAIVGIKNIIDKYKKEGDVSHQEEVLTAPIEKEITEAEGVGDSEEELAQENSQEEKRSEPVPPTPEEEIRAEVPAPPEAEVAVQPAAPAVAPSASVVTEETVRETPTPPTPQEENKTESPAVEKRQVEILLEALDRVQINLSTGGTNRKVSLNAGEIHILRTDEKVRLEISDGGALNLVVNGQNRGVPGSLGQRKTVHLP